MKNVYNGCPFLFIFFSSAENPKPNKIANKVQPFEPNIISVELSMNEVKLSVLVSLEWVFQPNCRVIHYNNTK
jgi:hypothetical protein